MTGSVSLGSTRRVMVLTDGAARLVNVFGSAWQHALNAGPGRIVREVRVFEAEDPACARWPRMKDHDDATAILWDIGTA